MKISEAFFMVRPVLPLQMSAFLYGNLKINQMK